MVNTKYDLSMHFYFNYEECNNSNLIILDRDGTLIENVPYLKDPDKIKFLDGVVYGLQLAQSKGFKFVVATNQSGINRKLININDVNKIHNEITKILLNFGVEMSDFIFCPHIPENECRCRKPNNLMIEKIIEQKKISRNKVVFIGDMMTDALAAEKSNIKSILIQNSKSNLEKLPKYSIRKSNFYEAIQYLITNN